MRRRLPCLMLAVVSTVTVATLAGCASGQVRPIELKPSPADGSVAIVDASELAKAYGDEPRPIRIVNDGPGVVEVGVFKEAVEPSVDHDKAVERRTLQAGSEEVFQYPEFGSLVIVNRGDDEVKVRVIH